jgi:hypothetical protein
VTGDPFVVDRGQLFTVACEPAAVSIVEDGRGYSGYLVQSPRKLTRLDEPADLAR